jgi:molybdenum cofactor guanylyltransferase
MNMTDGLPITAAVLAGGRSMRMGVDKTLLPVDGETLVARVVSAVGEVCAHTMVVTNRPEALEDAGLPATVRVITDEVPYQGPLGGLVTTRRGARRVGACGRGGHAAPLARGSSVRSGSARSAQVVVPVGDKGPEPLLALYSTSVLPAARKVLETGRRRLVALFSEVDVIEVPLELAA